MLVAILVAMLVVTIVAVLVAVIALVLVDNRKHPSNGYLWLFTSY